jgi:hypothetical protein
MRSSLGNKDTFSSDGALNPDRVSVTAQRHPPACVSAVPHLAGCPVLQGVSSKIHPSLRGEQSDTWVQQVAAIYVCIISIIDHHLSRYVCSTSLAGRAESCWYLVV